MSDNPTAIRLTRTREVEHVLKVARRHPALNDPEIFKLALSRLVYEPNTVTDEIMELESRILFGGHGLLV